MADASNPYIAGSPVTGTEMFFGRDDIFDFIRHSLIGKHRDNPIVLYGQRRTGKTSVLYQMNRNLGPNYLCVFIDLHALAIDGLGGFLWELANYIARTLRRDYHIDIDNPSESERSTFLTDPRNIFENEFLSKVLALIGDQHLLLMIDEAIRLHEQVKDGKLEKSVFEYLRHLMQHYERLIFLFSIGSGLADLTTEYAFMFNASLYKEISFLDREAAIALITQPVKDYYQVTPEAVDHILQITSRHPYYIQLLCHSLFNRQQKQHNPQLQIEDVDAILDEAVERGSAVLKHVWDLSTPAEKAVLVALACSITENNRSAGQEHVVQIWAQKGVKVPESDQAIAIKSLISRDVIVGQDKFSFTVDILRLWVQKHKRLEWVKEEISEEIAIWGKKVDGNGDGPNQSHAKTILIIAGLSILGLIFIIFFGMLGISNFLASLSSTATLTKAFTPTFTPTLTLTPTPALTLTPTTLPTLTDTPTVTLIPTLPATPDRIITSTLIVSSTFEVMSNRGWQDSGIYIQVGDRVIIKYISGLWKGSPNDTPYGPAPTPDKKPHSDCYSLKMVPPGFLIGRIAFYAPIGIGNAYDNISTAKGELFLRMNDCDQYFSDNEGSLMTSIQISR